MSSPPPGEDDAAPARAIAPGPFAPFQFRDYRLLITGQSVYTLGRQMQAVALTYQVYHLHESTLELGTLGLVRLIPALSFAMLGGVLADRVDRRRLLLLTQPALLACALILALATRAGVANLAVIYAIAALSATISTVDDPAREALLPALVPREHLPNALSWDITLAKVAAIAGPALGGLAIAWVGIAGTYALEACAFVVMIGAVFGLGARLGAAAPDAPPGWRAAFEGFHFVRRNPLILGIMSLDLLANFWGSASILLPVLADRVFNLGPRGLGFLYSVEAVGAVLGASVVASLAHRVRRPGLPLLGALVGYGVATIGLGLATSLPFAFLALAGIGLADTVGMAFRSQILQLATPNALRGRVTAAEQLFTSGGPQAGQFEAGAVAARFGAPIAVISGGIACIISVALVAWLVPAIRRYDRDHETGDEPVHLA